VATLIDAAAAEAALEREAAIAAETALIATVAATLKMKTESQKALPARESRIAS